MIKKTAKKAAKNTVKKAATLKTVIVRTYSAGVHFGYLVYQNGK